MSLFERLNKSSSGGEDFVNQESVSNSGKEWSDAMKDVEPFGANRVQNEVEKGDSETEKQREEFIANETFVIAKKMVKNGEFKNKSRGIRVYPIEEYTREEYVTSREKYLKNEVSRFISLCEGDWGEFEKISSSAKPERAPSFAKMRDGRILEGLLWIGKASESKEFSHEGGTTRMSKFEGVDELDKDGLPYVNWRNPNTIDLLLKGIQIFVDGAPRGLERIYDEKVGESDSSLKYSQREGESERKEDIRKITEAIDSWG